ncbi:Uncharacterised protein [Mycoplasmopsis citelli]|uniref:Uncharacterized protein n=1 Tax=Mycoplasmopsis citelli TaxID=171281 RepID=A0A449B0X4_9BACT|nr:hypothetical protein [Mycoplasmopsis citelli]VEU74260.1 Uncharacterised protein [Mycoplasmopsis citelli]
MKNQRKAIIGLGITAGVTAASALVSAGLALSLHSNYKVPHNQTYFFLELKNEVQKTQEQLKSFSISENSKNNTNEIKNLFSEIDHANQLLSNENSSVALMLEQRNKLKHLAPKALLSVTTIANKPDESKKLIEQYYSLVKDVDFQKVIENAKNTVVSSLNTSNNIASLNAFYNVVDPLIVRQNEFSFSLETKIWTDYDKLSKDNSVSLTAQEKSALISSIEQILNLLAEPQYSRDAILEYNKVYDEIVKKLSINKAQESKNLHNFLKNVIRVRNEIGLLKIKEDVKKDFFKRIDNYKEMALAPIPTLAVDKAHEIDYLNKLVNNQLATITSEDINQNKNLTLLSQNLQALNALNVDEKIKALINKQVDLIQKDVNEHPENVLNYISQANNLKTAIENIEKLISDIKDKINKYLNIKDISETDAKGFNDQLNAIILAEHKDINEYLINLNALYNKIYDNSLLSGVFKDSLTKLKLQVEESLYKGFGVDKNALTTILDKINSLVNNGTSLKDLNDGLRTLSNGLREINRIELKNLYKATVSFLTKDSIVSEEIKDRLIELNTKTKPLIEDSSAAIRDDLQFLIGEYKKQLQRANISDELQKTLLKHFQTKEHIEKVFGGPEEILKSPFGKKLLEHIDELKKQAKIIELDPNPDLDEETKKQLLAQIQNKLDNIFNNAQNYKDLEQEIANGDIALESSKGKTSEQASLEKEALAIKQLQNEGFEALNNAPTSKDVNEIVDKLKNAISDYKEKQSVYQSTKALEDKFKEIEDTFAPYAPAGSKTPTQENLTNKLKDYQKELTNPTLSNEERDKVNEKIAHLVEVVGNFKELEVANNALKELIKDTEILDFASFKPEQDYTNAKNLTKEIDQYLIDAFNAPFNRAEIEEKIKLVQVQSKTLELAIAVAMLRKTNSEIQANKITNASLVSQAPYNVINTSIESLNIKVNDLISNTSKTAAQVNSLNDSLKGYANLARSLKASADKLASLSQSTNPLAYQALLDSITNKPNGGGVDEPSNSLINFGDSISIINFKTRILNAELAKTDTRVQVENNINTLKMVYGQNEQNRAIFDEAIAAWNTKINTYTDLLKQFYVSRNNLATLRDDIDFYHTTQTNTKNAIEKAWNDALALKNQTQAQFDARKQNDNLTTVTFTDEAFAAFETLKDKKDANNKFITLTPQLLDKLKEVPLGYAKDLFIQLADRITNRITQLFDNYSPEVKNTYANNWKNAINKWIEVLKTTIKSYSSVDDILKIQNDYSKVFALNQLADQFDTIFRYLNSTKSRAGERTFATLQRENPNNALFAKLQNTNTYTTADDATLYNKTRQTIILLRNELRNTYLDVADFQGAKEVQVEQIRLYRGIISQKILISPSIDITLQTQIENKLNELIDSTTNATSKNELVNFHNQLSDIKIKQKALLDLATQTQTSEDLIRNWDNNTTPDQTGKISIIHAIENTYNSYKNSYLTLTEQELVSKKQQLENLGILFNDFEQVYNQVQQDKQSVPMSYPDGTGAQGTGNDGLNKMNGYYDNLLTMLNTTPVTQDKIISVRAILNTLSKLITLQADKINTQTQVVNDSEYSSVEYKTGTNANYGFDTDAKKLADAILKSIPDNSKSALDIENTLYPQLVSEFDNQYHLYLARKNGLDLIYKNGNVDADKGIKVKQIEKITVNNQIDSMYDDLKAKMNDFFHTEAEKIQNANDTTTIDNSIQTVSESDVFFDKYKQIAELIAKANAAKALVNANIQANPNVTESLQKINEEINKGKSYYYTQKDVVMLDNNIFFLNTYIARLKLATQVANLLNNLTSFNTAEGTAEFLSADAKIPLESIINKPFTDLKATPSLETQQNYERLLETYITSSSPQSFNVAFLNSKELQATIYKAQQYLNSYKAKLANNANYEPQSIQALYNALESKITEATTILKAANHNEVAKVRVTSELFNSNDGALDKIFKAIDAKIKAQYNKNLELSKFMVGAYVNGNVTPKLQDYDQVALTDIETTDISTPQKLEELNTKYQNAIDKYEQQSLDVFKWEANRYNSFRSKIQVYTNFFSDTNNGVDKEFILKVTGITQGTLDSILNKLSVAGANLLDPSNSNSIYQRVLNYALEVTKDDDQIREFLKGINSNNIVKELHEIGSEFLSDFQNLILITSVPNVLLAKSEYEKINEQLQVDQDKGTAGYTLQQINQRDTVVGKIQPINSGLNNIDPQLNDKLRADVDESQDNFSSVTNLTNVNNLRKNYFDDFKSIVVSIAKVKQRLDSLVYGENANDSANLKDILHKYILGDTGFVGRANIENFLKFIADASQLNQSGNNDKFKLVKDEYQKLATPAIENEKLLDNLTKNRSSDFDIYNAITKAFSRALALHEWMNTPSNRDLFFDYLSQVTNGIFNYQNIIAKDRTQIRGFVEYLTGNNIPESTLRIDGIDYKARRIDSAFSFTQVDSFIGGLFEKFNALKGNGITFNKDNVEVYIYKSDNANVPYVVQKDTNDTSIKRGFVNLYFKFKKPASLNDANNAFGDVEDFGVKFENVGINFKTLDRFVISEKNITNSQALTQPIFTLDDVGWNNLQAPYYLSAAFTKYSTLKAREQGNSKNYFTENVNSDLFGPDTDPTTQQFTSGPDFRVKVKFGTNRTYKGYRQVGNAIFWKTLNPLVGTVSDIKYKQNDPYLSSVISNADRNSNQYEQRYLYKVKDGTNNNSNDDVGKTLVFLPLVIGIPVRNTAGEDALLVLSWQIFNRFSTDTSSQNETFSLGNDAVLSKEFIFKRTSAGSIATQTQSTTNFYDHIMSKIKYRDLVGLTFINLQSSGLWEHDPLITTDTQNSFDQGIGTAEFANAIGTDGRFEIQFKLH